MSPIAELHFNLSSDWVDRIIQAGVFIVDGKPATKAWFEEHAVVMQLDADRHGQVKVTDCLIDGLAVCTANLPSDKFAGFLLHEYLHAQHQHDVEDDGYTTIHATGTIPTIPTPNP